MVFLLRLLIFSILVTEACGCAKRTTVALVPDPDGKIGSVSIVSKSGSVVLGAPFEETAVTDPNQPPTAPKDVGSEHLFREFAGSLSIQPEPPLHFLLFFHRETEMTEESLKEIPSVVKAIQARHCTFVSVVGNTDTLASEAYNFFLGFDRAIKVRGLLIKHGVDPASIWVYDQGKTNLLVPTRDQVYEPKNRRVEVIVR